MPRNTLPDRSALRSYVGAFVPGDDLSLRRTIDRDGGGEADEVLPAGVTISRAWLTIKTLESDADPGIVQKEITTANVVGTGQIEDDGTGDTDPVLRFDLVPADTVAIGVDTWEDAKNYDVQVLTSGGKIYTPERGRITAQAEQITQDDA